MADQPSLYQQLDQGLTNVFGPINRGLRSVISPMSPAETFMMALSAIRPGAGGAVPRLNAQPQLRLPTKAQDNVPPGGTSSHYWVPFETRSTSASRMSGIEPPHADQIIPLRFTPRFGSQAPPHRRGQTLGQGVSYDIVAGSGTPRPSSITTDFRINSFKPQIESRIQQLRPSTRTLTPANSLTPEQQYNLSLMRQLLGE